MKRVALVVGQDVGQKGRRKLSRWRWVRVDPGFAAVEAGETLRPALVVVKELPQPVPVVASLRVVAPRAAIVVLAARFDEVEGAEVLAAGADCYRDARRGGVEDAIIRAAEAVRQGDAPEDAPPEEPPLLH
jgi:DNA-binding NarL/FixJ family response regulator